MFCSKCGVENQAGSKFCSGCGSAISVDVERAAVSNASTATGVAENFLEVFIGKNFDHYKKMWGLAEGGKKSISFNPAAFMANGIWMAYRKMYFNASMLFLAFCLVKIMQYAFNLTDGWVGFLNISLCLACGFMGNSLYRTHAERKITAIATETSEPQIIQNKLVQQGGTNEWAAVGFVLASIILAVLFFEASNDPVKDELTKYANEMRAIAASENEMRAAFVAVQSTASQSASGEEIITSIKDSVFKCQEYGNALTKITGQLLTPEVQRMHGIITEAIAKTCAGQAMILEGIEKDDFSKISQGNSQKIEAVKLKGSWDAQLEFLTKKHHPELSKKS